MKFDINRYILLEGVDKTVVNCYVDLYIWLNIRARAIYLINYINLKYQNNSDLNYDVSFLEILQFISFYV